MAEVTNGLRTWGDGDRCAECCTGDRCDDPTHVDRAHCPYCKSTGYALWTIKGRDAYAARQIAIGRTNGEVLEDLNRMGYPYPSGVGALQEGRRNG